MTKEVYRYTFESDVPLEDLETSLLLAVLSTESLHGEAQVRLDAAHFFDPDQRACVIDATTPVGRDINRLFVGFVRREFGEDSFRVERVNQLSQQLHQEVQT
jgi:hypothetical protein